MITRVESPDLLISLGFRQLHALLDYPLLQLPRPWPPPATLLEFWIEQDDDRNRPRLPAGEVGVHDVQIFVTREDSHVHVADGFRQLGDDRNDVYRIAAPILAQHQEVPLPVKRLDARRDFERYVDAMSECHPQLMILDWTGHELGERLTFVEARFGNHSSWVGKSNCRRAISNESCRRE